MGTATKPNLKFKFLKKASELEAKPIRALIYGEPGVGKTTLLATLPKPVAILDFEGGAAVRLRGEEDIYIAEIGSYEELKEALKELETLKEVKSIAFDGFSVFLQALLDEITAKAGRKPPTFREWNLLTTIAKSIILNLRKPDKHLVFTAFEKVRRDKDTGKVVEIHPDLPTAVRRYLRGLVDLEGRMVWDIAPKSAADFNEPVIVFADPIAETKDRTGKLSVEEPDFGKILEKVFGKEESNLRLVPARPYGYPTKGRGKHISGEIILDDADLDEALKEVEKEEKKEAKAEPEPATQNQIGYIHKLVKNLGWSDEKYRTWLKDIFVKESSKDLTKYEASRAIELLQGELKKQKEQKPKDDDIIL